MIAVSLNVGGRVRLIKTGKTVHMHAKDYKHEDVRTAPGVCGNDFRTADWNTHTHTGKTEFQAPLKWNKLCFIGKKLSSVIEYLDCTSNDADCPSYC